MAAKTKTTTSKTAKTRTKTVKASATAKASGPRKSANPLLGRWKRGPLDLPPFGQFSAADFPAAFREGMKRHAADIAAITRNEKKPTFANTIVPLEKAGDMLERTASLFWNLVGADSTDDLRRLESEWAPKLAAHSTRMMLDPKLFKRIEAVWEKRDSATLDAEQRRVVDLHYRSFVRAGAQLGRKEKARVGAINERLASLVATFMQNVLKDEQSWRMELAEKDLDGLPDNLRAAARRAADDAGLPDKYVITAARSSVEGFLTFSSRRDLREKAFRAWTARGANGGETDNTKILAEVVQLRADYARLLGYENFAAYTLDDAMAKTPAAVHDLLQRMWTPALAAAMRERDALQEEAKAEGAKGKIAAWDWRFYAEKVRRKRFDFDESALRPYLELDYMIEAAFDCATKLFGLRFTELKDAPRYHPDVRVWKVTKRGGDVVGLFLGDYFARPSKRSGAWMSAFRSQNGLEKVRPIIVNVLNFARAGDGEPVLLSWDDARTLFHEFGHALHGLLSDVTYPSIAGTAVSRDFVELPSQLYEHWLDQKEVLRGFARHWKTAEPIPDSLIRKLKAARNFNQGFATVEYLSSALVDMKLFEADAGDLDMIAFEKATLAEIGMPDEIVMRHRLPHFMHIVGGYGAAYYSYLWSEVMDADAFEAFIEAGSPFDRKMAKKLQTHIYAAGNRSDPEEAWRAFRGRPPRVEGLLKKRGLAA